MQIKNHILITPSWYPSFPGDIGGSFFREQALALRKRGHKVGVIAPTFRSFRDVKGIFNKPYGIKVEVDEGISTHRYHTMSFPKMSGLNKSRFLQIGERLFEKYIKENGIPDLIHVHSMINAGFIALRLKEKYDIPYLVTVHSTAFARKLVPSSVLDALQPVVNEASHNIAVSGEFKKLLNKIFNTNKWVYVPNIVNDEFFKMQLPKNKKEQFTFINVCFLDRKKRVDLLINAFAKVFKGQKDIRLKIGGDGSEKNNLIEQAEQLGVSKQIDFLGRLTRDQVKHEVLSADAFVLSSEYETFGVVLIEALALGKPIIATKCGGPESIISPEVGYLVEKNSIDDLARAMSDLFENYGQFESEEIREYCIQQFSEDAVIKKLETIYMDVLS